MYLFVTKKITLTIKKCVFPIIFPDKNQTHPVFEYNNPKKVCGFNLYLLKNQIISF